MMLTDRQITIGWFGSAATSVILPLLVFTIARATNSAGEDDENGQNNNNDENQGCKWYQWGCRNNYNENGGQNDKDEENGLPWWWLWAADERRPDDATNPTLVVIYIWSLILFGAVVYYGHLIHRSEIDDNRILIGALLMFGNLSFLGMLFLGGLEGGVQDEGRVLEEHGFYGQFGVLVFMTYFLMTVFSLSFTFLFRRELKKTATKIEIDESDYKIHNPSDDPVMANETV